MSVANYNKGLWGVEIRQPPIERPGHDHWSQKPIGNAQWFFLERGDPWINSHLIIMIIPNIIIGSSLSRNDNVRHKPIRWWRLLSRVAAIHMIWWWDPSRKSARISAFILWIHSSLTLAPSSSSSSLQQQPTGGFMNCISINQGLTPSTTTTSDWVDQPAGIRSSFNVPLGSAPKLLYRRINRLLPNKPCPWCLHSVVNQPPGADEAKNVSWGNAAGRPKRPLNRIKASFRPEHLSQSNCCLVL